jgi:histidyl-tRNA synthetase
MARTTNHEKKLGALSGALDIVSSFDPTWLWVLEVFHNYSRQYGFTPVSIPLLEDASLYRNIYGAKDNKFVGMVVSDLAGQALAIRTSLLPGVLRIISQSKLAQPALLKWVYEGSVVRVEGKEIKSDYEFGFEVWGEYNHLTEAQVLGAAWQMMSLLGLTDVIFEINTCGSSASQKRYAEALVLFLGQKKYQLCDACADSIDGDVFEALRCQNLDCHSVLLEAPTILDFLDEASKADFTNLLEALEELQIPYQLNPLLVSIPGSTGTVAELKLSIDGRVVVIAEAEGHEVILNRLGAKTARAFGLHGSLLAAHGAIKLRTSLVKQIPQRPRDVYLVPLGELAAKRSLRLFRDLVEAGVSVFDHFGFVGVKNQLKAAQDANSPVALIMGQKEALDEAVILRDVRSGMQEVFSYDKIVTEVKKRLGQ